MKTEGSVGKPDPVKAIAAELRKLREISFGDPYEREAAGILAALRVLAELQNAEAAKNMRNEALKKLMEQETDAAFKTARPPQDPNADVETVQPPENTETWPPSHEG